MYRRILVPVDGSTASNAGRAHAIGLAQTEGARLRFLNVIDESVGFVTVDIGTVDMIDVLKSARELGEKSVDEAARSRARRACVRTLRSYPAAAGVSPMSFWTKRENGAPT